MTVNGLFVSNLGFYARGWLYRLIGDRRAVTAVEYAIIVGIMALAIVTGVRAIGPELSVIFNNVGTEL